MIDFLFKSSVSLLALLLFYHLVLEKEKMYRFNRYFLLISLLFSLVIPFTSFEINQDMPAIYSKIISQQVIAADILPIQPEVTNISDIKQTNYWVPLLWLTYSIITLVLSIRFIRKIYIITAKAKLSKVVIYQNTKVILLTEDTLPYTFLDSIYMNRNDYENGKIEQELFTHEITHVKQKHTLDVIFIEILKTLFWFNPLFIFYKKAIQLNHEFLADENVIATHQNISFYQNLLLNKVSAFQPFLLTSNLNFLATRKRLIMMTKNTSKSRTASIKLLAVLGISAIFILVSFKPLPLDKKIIVIDAGHGGNDNGAQIGAEQEKKIVENIANKINSLNKKGEIEIVLLRKGDRFIALNERVLEINKINPSLVISLHIDASKNINENGVHAYVSKQNVFYEKSMENAKNLVDEITNEKLANGGVKDADSFIIKNSKCPALLVEIGYLSNQNDRTYLTSENGQNEIANKIFEFIKK
ncbi:N-acetylmuramoyl-L-alanine amidase [Flavobacterium aquicola]|uniref:N-acetylmuramoyl-L-alanine amidase n=1 Tax=Flavobacterium aquicola TaxID=1682742 RepID=A0A3E0EFP2_9FLAO|nr:N-acetylmuramoyl-L-alanine amidase [Flavobacterium aquicola]REG96470.1 N-acetylmuramoyl-L-alanine amidase [Flavobacterium aquicola]